MIYKKERAFPQLVAVFSLMISLVFIANSVSSYVQNHIHLIPIPLLTPSTTLADIGGIIAPDGELIGVSDGKLAFDTAGRVDKTDKQQASNQLQNGNKDTALTLWEQAIREDTNDAEALIYLEDQRVLATGLPYITLVVGTTLTGSTSHISTGRDNLQGAYVAQKEYNDGMKIRNDVQVVLLIANAGKQSVYATLVAEQIVSIAKRNSHIVGVMGWPFSAFALNAVPILSAAHIPMVSPTASSDSLTNISPFFFRIVPSNKSQSVAGAQYAEQQLHTKRVALFSDPDNAYSNSLAKDFRQRFLDDGNQVVAEEHYTVGKPETLSTPLQMALSANPDLIYFAGYADDMGALLTNFPATSNVQLLGGDALYELGGYPSAARAGFTHLHFTAFAYPDTWDIMGMGSQKPPFFTLYAQTFDPLNQHTASPYGYSRADNDTILSYDAMLTLLTGGKNALAGGKTSLTPDDLQQNLAKINGSNAIQGVSGQISFGQDGDPLSKAIVVLTVDSEGYTQLSKQIGCFQVGKC